MQRKNFLENEPFFVIVSYKLKGRGGMQNGVETRACHEAIWRLYGC